MQQSPMILSVIQYAFKQKRVSAPMLQNEFGISYKQAQEIIQTLIKQKFISFVGGIMYEYTGEDIPSADSSVQDDRRKAIFSDITNESDGGDDDDPEEKAAAELIAKLLNDDDDDDDDILLDDDDETDKKGSSVYTDRELRAQRLHERLSLDLKLRQIAHLMPSETGEYDYCTGLCYPDGTKIVFSVKKVNERFVLSDKGLTFAYLIKKKTESDKYSAEQYWAKEIVYTLGAVMEKGGYSYDGAINVKFDEDVQIREAVATLTSVVLQICKLDGESRLRRFYDDCSFFSAYVAKLVFSSKKDYTREEAIDTLKKFSEPQYGSHYAACRSLINSLLRMSDKEYNRYKKSFEEDGWNG